MLVNLFHGYSHLVNGVVFSCNMFPGHVVGLYCYGYTLFGVTISQDKRYNDIQACNLSGFFISNYDCFSIISGFQLKLGSAFRSRYSDVM